ncbi:sarcosine oxidase [Halogranum amylolyticum]|uniref:Sarcosine oxidase n=1 Tax=Halogranum amylolyticum TaxID=660520 RepID=A0A1H8V6C1_9EURY|nr:N-methyl-L-tryptophan oxidase [Halogranum amylolyticum]SEP11022.1 sarcosine oxidase [Halogranum amylolyticum]
MTSSDTHYDVIVVGVGGMGSAATYHLAKRGHDVLGLEQFDIPHEKGSNHGVTRIIRKAYFESPAYVPLLDRAYENWETLQEENGRQLLHLHGSITAGRPDEKNLNGAVKACEIHDLPYEVLTSDELSSRFPGYQLPDEFKAVYQPDGGFLASDRCLIAHVEEAFNYGAEIHAREQVLDWKPTSTGVRVETDDEVYTADRLVISAGPWAQELVEELAGSATPERQVLGWLQPNKPSNFTPENFPIFTATLEGEPFYGFPTFEAPGFKIGRHHHLEQDTTPETLDDTPRPEDERLLRNAAETYFPSGAGPTLRLATCMYTNSPDEEFVIDTHPAYSNVVLAAGFSGHGYKFCSVVGEILADLAIDGETEHPIDLFRFDRLG